MMSEGRKLKKQWQTSKKDLKSGCQTKRVELHVHTREGSPCAQVPVFQAVNAYAGAGYQAMVITNHFNRDTVPKPGLSAREAVEHYVDIYRRAKEYGQQIGIDVWFGIETNLKGGKEDFLLYGATPDILYENPKMYDMTQQELFRECEQFRCLLYQAHPFRDICHPRDPEFLHGAEVYNGNPRSVENNDKAVQWAKENGLLMSSGSDFHWMSDLGRGGILVPETIGDVNALAVYLRENEVSLITT